MVAHFLLLFIPCISTLPKHVVIGKSRTAKGLSKSHFLLSGWIKPEFVGALNFHLHIMCVLCKIVNKSSIFRRKEAGLGDTLHHALFLTAVKGSVSRA